MNAIYSINYFIFSIFFTLFMLELGIALISLLDYDLYKERIKHAIGPVWGITGTFAIFYLVNFEVSYPGLVALVGTAYVIPLLAAAIFIILRNIFIAFSEYIGENRSERRFRIVYSLSTIIAAILLVAVLASGISGIGINLSTSGINYSLLLNPFYIMILFSILLLSFSLANNIIKPARLFKPGIASLLLGFALGLFAVYTHLPALHQSIQTYALTAASLVLLIISSFLQFKEAKHASAFSILSVLILINLFGIASYPYILGSRNVTAYMAASSVANASILITTIGGVIVAVSLILFIYMNYLRKQ